MQPGGPQEGQLSNVKGGAVSALALVTLRIIDRHEGITGALATRSQALKCQSREDIVSSDVVVGMFSFVFFMPCYLFLYVSWNHVLVCVCIIFG